MSDDDGLFDIFAIEQKRLADEARARGDTRAASIHSRQATRFWNLQNNTRRSPTEHDRICDAAFAAENPPHLMTWERQREHLTDMIPYVHIHREGVILCRGGLYQVGKFPAIKAVGFRPGMNTRAFLRSYRDTDFYKDTMKDLCPACLVEDEMIKNGVVP